jgi:hypothetical protein
MNVSMEDAYAEACRALGESIVRERLLSQALASQQKPDASTEPPLDL